MPAILNTATYSAEKELRNALWFAFCFATAKFAIHFCANLWQAYLGWGYFGDEFYYIACGRHLAWGYVDHGPLVAVQARLSELLFGHSLAGLRLLSALGGASRVFLTGILAFLLGGRRPAQGLAMTAVLITPAYLGADSVLSMSSNESTFWMACLVTLLVLQRELGMAPQPGNTFAEGTLLRPSSLQATTQSGVKIFVFGPWIIFGGCAGLCILNKPSMAFFLAALGASLMATHVGRKLLLRREALAGVALMVVIAFPYFFWQARAHWPLLEFLHTVRVQRKSVTLGPVGFFTEQIIALNSLNGLVWLPGLIYLLRRKRTAYLGLTYVMFLGLMILFGAKSYYAQPIYPVLFAAGGLVWERIFSTRSRVVGDRAFAFPVATGVLAISSLVTLPMSLPVLSPRDWVRYAGVTGLYVPAEEGPQAGLLQPFYAARFGWQEEANQVKSIVTLLSPEDRGKVTLLCDNYQEAGALQFLAPELPRVISGHNTYWLWGPGNSTGEVVVLITGRPIDELRREYEEVELVGTMNGSRFQVPSERRKRIYLGRHRHRTFQADWLSFKSYG